ncbi:MAG: hypothetical protein JXB35_08120 [Anaerolineae bacterium]|nr:hypothetical protein [Anaerolineae bacterium]
MSLSGLDQVLITVNARYQAYLLRIWQETPGAPWRILLQDATTGERSTFVDLEALLSFLQTQMELPDATFAPTDDLED